MRRIATAIFAVSLLVPLCTAAAPTEGTPVEPPAGARRLVIGTKVAVPFSFKKADGTWTGISIDLWRAIAVDRGWKYEFQERSLEGLLQGVQDGTLDAAIAAITVTAEREDRFDFSQPFFTTGLAIAVPTERAGWFRFVERLFSMRFFMIVGGLALLLLLVGALVWLVERKRNAEQFGGSVAHGLGAGFWWSAVTMTTVGYGDKAPMTVAGRLIGLVWMFASLIAISTFTAAIASILTVNQLESVVKSPKDLPKVVVGTVPASTSEAYLDQHGISTRTYPTIDDALGALSNGEVGAVVYDAPILRYLIKQRYRAHVTLLPGTFRRQNYAIALPESSSLREPINRTMLRLVKEPLWDAILTKYLGSGD